MESINDNEIMVSICCITYNHEKYIKYALDSFLMQETDFKYEIIIHDDASTDNTPNIIKEYECKYPEIIKPIYRKENQYSKGKRILPFTLNNAKGRYIAICEGDDYWTDKNKLQIQVDYFESHKNCTLCFHSYDLVDGNNKILNNYDRYDYDCISPMEDIIIGGKEYWGGGFCITPSLMFPRKIVDNLPNYYYNCSVGDYPLQLYCASKGYAYYISKSMCAYRTNISGSWTTNLNKGEENEVIQKKISHYVDIINMLNNFNKSTNEIYARSIKKMIDSIEYSYFYCEKNKLYIFKNKEFQKYIRKFALKDKILIFLQVYFPKTLSKAVSLKHRIT